MTERAVVIIRDRGSINAAPSTHAMLAPQGVNVDDAVTHVHYLIASVKWDLVTRVGISHWAEVEKRLHAYGWTNVVLASAKEPSSYPYGKDVWVAGIEAARHGQAWTDTVGGF